MKQCKQVVIKKFCMLQSHNFYFTELKKSRTDLETLKKQAEATNSEYDRLSSEYQNLQVS